MRFGVSSLMAINSDPHSGQGQTLVPAGDKNRP
jgi:hypothetical protein